MFHSRVSIGCSCKCAPFTHLDRIRASWFSRLMDRAHDIGPEKHSLSYLACQVLRPFCEKPPGVLHDIGPRGHMTSKATSKRSSRHTLGISFQTRKELSGQSRLVIGLNTMFVYSQNGLVMLRTPSMLSTQNVFALRHGSDAHFGR